MNDVYEAIIEIPMGTKNKYEINKLNGKIKLDRVLYSSLSYPGEYGFIDGTLSEDGDPLDILIICSEPTFPGCTVDARVLGYLEVIDNNEKDEKVIAVVDKDPRFNEYKEIESVPEHILIEIKDFFQNYKNLQNIKVQTKSFHSKKEAIQLIALAQKRKEENNNH